MMDPSDIIRLLNSNHYAPANLEEVDDLCRNFPEFNLAHMLKVRIRESLGQKKDKELKIAAIYASDRRKLYQLVTGVNEPVTREVEPDISPEDTGGIQFSDETHQQADVIIEQHAPYVGPLPDDDLLVLDEDFSSEPPSEVPAIEVTVRKKVSRGNILIENFIHEAPGPIRADRKATLRGDASLASIREHDGFITDTLAKIYVKQGLYAKAIYAYEKLSLKYPEKSAYFAAQIEKIKNINHS